jgi:hypothetical protein
MTEGQILEGKEYPWAEANDEITCNFALGDLILNLPRRLTVEGRVHAETMLAASGAIAGYAAQQTLLSDIGGEANLAQHGLQILSSKAGNQYYYGEALNRRLINQGPEDAREKLWSLAAGGAVGAGLAVEALPDLQPMYTHVSRTLGSETEGLPSLAGHRPQMPVRQLLTAVWPLALMCFDGELSAKVVPGRVVAAPRWRPAIAAWAANKFIRDVQSVLAPDKALIVLFESAICASKLRLQLG